MGKIVVLGSGTSTGVPQIGCTCKVCTSADERDRRLRCSALVEMNGVRLLIDCGPDFREQMIRLDDFAPIDGVLIRYLRKKIQGYTGDCCGALFLLSEFSFYLTALCMQ